MHIRIIVMNQTTYNSIYCAVVLLVELYNWYMNNGERIIANLLVWLKLPPYFSIAPIPYKLSVYVSKKLAAMSYDNFKNVSAGDFEPYL